MKFPVGPVFVLILLTCFASAIWVVSHHNKKNQPETWTSFVYYHGYDSEKYKKNDNFNSYESCKSFAKEQSSFYDNVPWECGLMCVFDTRKQGFQCQEMRNEH